MAKQTINVGVTANDKKGDSLRAAFQKVNANFTELYTALGLNDPNLNLGAFEFNGSTMTTTDSSNMTIGEEGTVINIGGDLVPTSNLNSTLGSPDKKWHSLYVGTGSVYFGDARLSLEDGKLNSSVGFNLTGSIGEVSGAVDWANVLNKPTIPSIAGLATETYVNNAISAIVIPDVSNFITADDIPAIPADISDLTDTTNLLQGTDFDQTLNTTDSVEFASVSVNGVVEAQDHLTITSTDVDALEEAYLEQVGQLEDQFAQGIGGTPYTGTGTPASKLSYEALIRARAINPLIPDVWITRANSLRNAYYAWAAASITLTPTSSGFTLENGGGVGLRYEEATGLRFPDNTYQTTAFTNETTDRLVSGDAEVVLNTDGDLILPRAVIAGRSEETNSVNGRRFVQDAVNGTSSMRWINLTEGNNAEIIRVYTGDPALDTGVERAQINIDFTGDNDEFSGITLRTYDTGDTPTSYRWRFRGDGVLQLPDAGDIIRNGVSVLGGGSTTQPYLELTNTPFITQPATLGTPVTITAPPTGNGASLSLTITAGPTLDVESVIIDSPGTGYVVGQRYKIWYWLIGGSNDNSSINFEVETVGEEGELLTVVNVAFEGGLATNTPGTYTNLYLEYLPSVFDEVDTGLTLTRGQYNGLFNSAVEINYNSNVSPTGTLWNSEGWSDLLRLGTRDYETFDSLNFDELTTLELVMWDTANDKYYKFDITGWNNDTGAYAYTRTLVTDPNYFRKTDGLEDGEVDVIVEHPDLDLLEETYLEAELQFGDFRDQDAQMIAPETRPWDGLPSYQAYELIITYEVPDGVLPPSSALVVMANSTRSNYLTWREALTASVGITRGLQGGIYNPYQEDGWDSNVSPAGTQWNIDGWNDLTNIESRIYTNFYNAYGNGQLGNRVPRSKAVMYVPETDKYYAIEWFGWTQGGDYGGFSYYRREIDLTKLTQGITFADGTVQTTAYVDTNVVSTAPGQRRIETASGYNQVSVTQRLTDNYTGAVSQTTNGYELRVARSEVLDDVLVPINEGDLNATFTLSFDNVNFREVWLSSVQPTEYWFYYEEDFGNRTPQTEDDPVYLRITTGGDSVTWWNKNDLPGGSDNFRGAVIDYHAFTDEATIIGTIHIVDDDGEEHITHTEVSSGNDDSMNDDLWIVTDEGRIRYARFDGEAKTLKIHWTAKVFYGDETND